MNSILTVTTPAPDRNLLTLAELRAAAGVSDNSQDASLIELGKQVSAAIVAACHIPAAGIVPATLRQEALIETFRGAAVCGGLMLSRRPIVAVAAVTEGDAALDIDYDIESDSAGGVIYRLSSDARIAWACGKIVVSYSAGWATVPDDLKFAAVKFVQSLRQQGDRDPMLKRKTTEGVSTFEWWVDPTKDSVVPGEVMDLLDRGGYVNKLMVL